MTGFPFEATEDDLKLIAESIANAPDQLLRVELLRTPGGILNGNAALTYSVMPLMLLGRRKFYLGGNRGEPIRFYFLNRWLDCSICGFQGHDDIHCPYHPNNKDNVKHPELFKYIKVELSNRFDMLQIVDDDEKEGDKEDSGKKQETEIKETSNDKEKEQELNTEQGSGTKENKSEEVKEDTEEGEHGGEQSKEQKDVLDELLSYGLLVGKVHRATVTGHGTYMVPVP